MMAAPELTLEQAGGFTLPTLWLRAKPGGPLVLIAQPLFEEQNRCRRFLAQLGRALSERGIATAMPDLPAAGDHPDLGPFSFAQAQSALAAFSAATAPALTVSLRAGALLVETTAPHTAIAPIERGERILSGLLRTHAVMEKERTGKPFTRKAAEAAWSRNETLTLAGYPITAETAAALTRAQSTAGTSLGAASLSLPPLWNQAEPVDAAAAASAAADAIAETLS
ncbi:MAG: hypothetical protein V2J26_08330 [Pacificimonas sp.]|jgi:hypothetical protein|nr:hypothetical protein [Pacificimonas sp.]